MGKFFERDAKHHYLSEYDKKFCFYERLIGGTGTGSLFDIIFIGFMLFGYLKSRSLSKKYGKKFYPLLTEQEKEILFSHVKDRTQDDPLRLNEQILKSLAEKNFVYYGFNFDNTAMFYYIQHWAWPFLKKKFKENKK